VQKTEKKTFNKNQLKQSRNFGVMSNPHNKTERYEDAINTLRSYKEDRESKAKQLANLKEGKNWLKEALFFQIRSKLAERSNLGDSGRKSENLMNDINDIIRSSFTKGMEDAKMSQINEFVSPMMQLSNLREEIDSLPDDIRQSYEEQLAKEFYLEVLNE
jgi:hypothetical protein